MGRAGARPWGGVEHSREEGWSTAVGRGGSTAVGRGGVRPWGGVEHGRGEGGARLWRGVEHGRGEGWSTAVGRGGARQSCQQALITHTQAHPQL